MRRPVSKSASRKFPKIPADSSHRAHDYPYLIERWRKVAARTGLVMRSYGSGPEFKLYSVRTKNLPREGAIYISAGIHGDEPAGPESLITWAEQNTRLLRRRPFFLLPCLNPWGLLNNIRLDSQGRDLNRCFQRDDVPELAALKKLLHRHRFSLALMLHEDYDGQGVYLYEIEGAAPYWGESMLEAASPYIPIEGRAMIEGREALQGLVRRPLDMDFFKEIGLPEAVYFYLHHAQRIFTIETPSEFALSSRIQAHIAAMDEAIARAIEESS